MISVKFCKFPTNFSLMPHRVDKFSYQPVCST